MKPLILTIGDVLRTSGLEDRSRLFDEMIEETRNRDDVAYARAKRAFWNSTPREADNDQRR